MKKMDWNKFVSFSRATIFAALLPCLVAMESKFIQQKATWYQAQLMCQNQGGQLGTAKSPDLAELSPFVSSEDGVWTGGRLIHSSWTWSDHKPLYHYIGCSSETTITNTTVMPTHPHTSDVFDCFMTCQTVTVGIKHDKCLCLKTVPKLDRNETMCNRRCAANFQESCGGRNDYSVYQRAPLPYALRYDTTVNPLSRDAQCGYLHSSAHFISADDASIFLKFDVCGLTSVERKKSLCQNCSASLPSSQTACTVTQLSGYTTWNEAYQNCLNEGMTLATPISGDLRPFFNFRVGTQESYWVGLRRETSLSWTDGTTLNARSFNTVMKILDGSCVAAVKTETGWLRLQLEDCSKEKSFVCDMAVPQVGPINIPGDILTYTVSLPIPNSKSTTTRTTTHINTSKLATSPTTINSVETESTNRVTDGAVTKQTTTRTKTKAETTTKSYSPEKSTTSLPSSENVAAMTSSLSTLHMQNSSSSLNPADMSTTTTQSYKSISTVLSTPLNTKVSETLLTRTTQKTHSVSVKETVRPTTSGFTAPESPSQSTTSLFSSTLSFTLPALPTSFSSSPSSTTSSQKLSSSLSSSLLQLLFSSSIPTSTKQSLTSQASISSSSSILPSTLSSTPTLTFTSLPTSTSQTVTSSNDAVRHSEQKQPNLEQAKSTVTSSSLQDTTLCQGSECDQKEEPGTNKDDDMMPIYVSVGVVAALLGIITTVILICIRKRRKSKFAKLPRLTQPVGKSSPLPTAPQPENNGQFYSP